MNQTAHSILFLWGINKNLVALDLVINVMSDIPLHMSSKVHSVKHFQIFACYLFTISRLPKLNA